MRTKDVVMLQWPKRPRIEPTRIGRRRVWTSRCGHYRVIHSMPECAGLAPRFYAEVRRENDAALVYWRMVERHRWYKSWRAAARACQRDARREAA